MCQRQQLTSVNDHLIRLCFIFPPPPLSLSPFTLSLDPLSFSVAHCLSHNVVQSQMEFVAKYENRTDSEYDRVLAGVMFDVIWVLAMALKETMAMINHGDISQTNCVNASGDLLPLEHFNYTNEKIGCLVQWNLQKTHFDGVSVSILLTISVVYSGKFEGVHFVENQQTVKITPRNKLA